MQLNDSKVAAVIAVSDIARAKEFYEGKLGLTGEEMGDGGMTYPCAEGTSVHVYATPHARPTEASAAGWEVDDLNAVVDELSSNGVSFEQYSELNTNEKGIADMGALTAAWCKDPDGNVIGFLQPTS